MWLSARHNSRTRKAVADPTSSPDRNKPTLSLAGGRGRSRLSRVGATKFAKKAYDPVKQLRNRNTRPGFGRSPDAGAAMPLKVPLPPKQSTNPLSFRDNKFAQAHNGH